MRRDVKVRVDSQCIYHRLPNRRPWAFKFTAKKKTNNNNNNKKQKRGGHFEKPFVHVIHKPIKNRGWVLTLRWRLFGRIPYSVSYVITYTRNVYA